MDHTMMASDPLTNILSMVPAGDLDHVDRVAVALVKAGYAVVLLRPGTKLPLCTLTARQQVTEDRKARAAAEAVSDPLSARRRHPCGIEHAFTDPAPLGRVLKRLAAAGVVPNIGLELGRSRLVVVDVDTQDEHVAFLRSWADALPGGGNGQEPTVATPGALKNGEWSHKDGGHYWFRLPDSVELPTSSGALKGSGGWSVMWANRQVLVPPSVRSEGPYRLVGPSQLCPDWIVERIRRDAAQRADRASAQVDRAVDADDPIERWSAVTPWSDLLLPDGWTETGLIDTCGCPVYTAPGVHASPKSATGHGLGCDRYDTDTGWGPLHVWTDNPPDELIGRKTVSKLTYLALTQHNGDNRDAMVSLDILTDLHQPSDFMVDDSPDPSSPSADHGTAADGDELDFEVPTRLTPAQRLREMMLSSAELDSIVEPEPLVDTMLDRDTVSRVIGKPGHGKTFVMLDMACCVATGLSWHGRPVYQGLVVYMAAEGVRGLKGRIRSWESRYHDDVRVSSSQLLIIPFAIQTANTREWPVLREVLKDLSPALVVFDTQARITVGVDENNAKEMGQLIEQMDCIRKDTAACVVLVHHMGHNGQHGRGSSAVLGAINTEIRVVKEGEVPDLTYSIHTDKQKDQAESEPVTFELSPEGSSAVVALDPFGEIKINPYQQWRAWLHEQVRSGARYTQNELIRATKDAGLEWGKKDTGNNRHRMDIYRKMVTESEKPTDPHDQ